MQVGFYRRSPLNFEPYRASLFQLQNKGWVTGYGCGANALASLTGEHPSDIADSCQGRHGHFPDKKMLSFLRRKGYKVIPVTQCLVSLNGEVNNVKANHVLLISQLLKKNEGSWVIVHGGNLTHNFDTVPLNALEFINRPILSAYIIFHPSWNKKDKKVVHSKCNKRV